MILKYFAQSYIKIFTKKIFSQNATIAYKSLHKKPLFGTRNLYLKTRLDYSNRNISHINTRQTQKYYIMKISKK